MFDFSFRNTIKRLLHPFYRKTKHIAVLMAFLVSIRRLKDNFITFRNKTEYDIKFNAQTLSLEARLNQEYNLLMGTIYIETVSSTDNAVYTFWLSENQAPVYVGWLSEMTINPVYTFWLSEPPPAGIGIEFIVWVPSTLNFDLEQMKAIINLYKLAGKRYAIKPY